MFCHVAQRVSSSQYQIFYSVLMSTCTNVLLSTLSYLSSLLSTSGSLFPPFFHLPSDPWAWIIDLPVLRIMMCKACFSHLFLYHANCLESLLEHVPTELY
ncbi:hypothetical protein BJX68DRAFT_39874 [Aspergillus pseudodeflectus]|uniref:Uncharacterized protein n=1 Tax=Aspergillus pseudodeflectus TaxID=176178 RepID=A0ABR4KPD4_9EURO